MLLLLLSLIGVCGWVNINYSLIHYRSFLPLLHLRPFAKLYCIPYFTHHHAYHLSIPPHFIQFHWCCHRRPLRAGTHGRG